jgi:hypothetical protein
MSARLRGLNVGLSGAVPDRGAAEPADAERGAAVLGFVARLAALTMANGGRVLHGSHPSLTPTLLAAARDASAARGEAAAAPSRPPLILVASAAFGDPPPLVAGAFPLAEVVVAAAIDAGDADETRTLSLTAMRELLTRRADVVVAVGGRRAPAGGAPGVLDELVLARWHRVPCFVVGGAGGFTGALDPGIVEQLSEGNGLRDDQVRRMAAPDNEMAAIAASLVEHFAAHPEFGRPGRTAAPGSIDEARARGLTALAAGDARRFGQLLKEVERP